MKNGHNCTAYSRIGINPNALSEQFINNLEMTRKFRLIRNDRHNLFINMNKKDTVRYLGQNKALSLEEVVVKKALMRESYFPVNKLKLLVEIGYDKFLIIEAVKTLIEKNLVKKIGNLLYWIERK